MSSYLQVDTVVESYRPLMWRQLALMYSRVVPMYEHLSWTNDVKAMASLIYQIAGDSNVLAMSILTSVRQC